MPSQKNSEFIKLIGKARFQKENSLPFVIYQKPNDVTVKGIFLEHANLTYASDFTEAGFIFSPFDNSDKTIVFPSDTINEVPYVHVETIIEETKNAVESGKKSHLALVEKTIKKIIEGELKKVVVSRKITTQTQKDAFSLFEQLLNTYSSAFKYLWFHPKVGMWLGATPETLLKVKEGTVSTTSLAGTLPVIAGEFPAWSKKEVEEQQLVTDYILDTLSGKLANIEVSTAKSVKAGKLWHLKSVLKGDLIEKVVLGDIIKALHPTPAVCGIPLKIAKEFLKENEGYNREFYTGFLGELNFGSDRNTHLFVNLRCMKLDEKDATVFIGGGITKDSIPNSEWEETQHKSKTMLSLL